ncbi:putative Cyclin-dependent kinase [Monocercomonoides exilis]|uniref:putative Cyclin-dependent kinase n=1 Tax=Monocercomonoides exilis TaxID=2049356 RepID=UPI003559D5B5|nr:putative Cyclin-dependent kinase [Monocercomonoides exilis]|eukprot:MONOS_8556.1-p1 / transcript=MONOS_8556.1 / gene=MONOS_8556 / organism=Monocercomonoides_exilis_PA203 / gene_product=Cyclin-dependent kinase / transcript_product=Cyclin-dependent kinase / location=Mono_scaffold00325:45369-47677(+) / protein_length=451 / sequence_SO=supercontig / SO=protein_coding / is_pseudo=false
MKNLLWYFMFHNYIMSDDVEVLFSSISSEDKLGKCRSIERFDIIGVIGEGTYGVVYKALDKDDGSVVALKQVKMDEERNGIPWTFLREIKMLKSIDHPNIVKLKEVVVGYKATEMFLNFEFCEHTLSELIVTVKHPFTESEIKCLMIQLLSALQYLHERWILHRDLKMLNLLYSNSGNLKLADFGLARGFDNDEQLYTPDVVTLWYRPPELLLGSEEYSTPIDIWGAGCIFAELFLRHPPFNGRDNIEMLQQIFSVLGTPTEETWPEFEKLSSSKEVASIPFFDRSSIKTFIPNLSHSGVDLLESLLCLDPAKRITAKEALNHPYFRESPIAKSASMMPSYPPTNVPKYGDGSFARDTKGTVITPRRRIVVKPLKSEQAEHKTKHIAHKQDDDDFIKEITLSEWKQMKRKREDADSEDKARNPEAFESESNDVIEVTATSKSSSSKRSKTS